MHASHLLNLLKEKQGKKIVFESVNSGKLWTGPNLKFHSAKMTGNLYTLSDYYLIEA